MDVSSRNLVRQNAHTEGGGSRHESGFGSSDSLELCSRSFSESKHGGFGKSFDESAYHQPGTNGGNSPIILLQPPSTERQISQASSGYGEGEYLLSQSSREDSRDWGMLPPGTSVERQTSQASSGFGEEEYRYLSAAARRKCLRSDRSDGKDSIEGKTSKDWGSQDIDDLNLSNASSVFESARPSQDRKPKWVEDVEAFEALYEQQLLVDDIEKAESITELCQWQAHPKLGENNNYQEGYSPYSGTTSEDYSLSNCLLISSESDTAPKETWVTGPDYDENMHLLPGRDIFACSHPASLMPDLLSLTHPSDRAHHLEWAHLCGVRVGTSPVGSCSSPDCIEAKCLLTWLDKCFHLGGIPDCILCERTLDTILWHNRSCPESNCSLPFCQIVTERHQHLGRQSSIEELKGEVSSFGKLSAMEALSSTIHSIPDKLDHAVQAQALPLAFLGKFGKFNVLLARLKRRHSHSSQSSTVVIKKVSRSDRLIQALKLVRSLNCDLFSRVIYVAEEESHTIVLSEFVQGMTFHEMLVHREGHWPWQPHYIAVIEAVSYLHQRNILFLNWEAENVLLKTTLPVIRQGSPSPCLVIGQQSLSLIPEGASSFPADESLRTALPPRVAAPEILGLQEVSFSADIWGLGVLLYQLTTRLKPYNKLRHYTWERTRDRILQDKLVPDLERCAACYREVLRQSLSWSPENRPSLTTLKEMFEDSWRSDTEP